MSIQLIQDDLVFQLSQRGEVKIRYTNKSTCSKRHLRAFGRTMVLQFQALPGREMAPSPCLVVLCPAGLITCCALTLHVSSSSAHIDVLVLGARGPMAQQARARTVMDGGEAVDVELLYIVVLVPFT